MKKIYIAGPDVFRPDALDIGQQYKSLCREYGYTGLFPLDNSLDPCITPSSPEMGNHICHANISLINQCDIVIANLNPFRGKEPDSGTVFECGYAYGKGKSVIGYKQHLSPYLESFGNTECCFDKSTQQSMDNQGMIIEDFSLPLNLMLSCTLDRIVQGDFRSALRWLVENLD